MGAIADGIMAYAQPLIDATDGSLQQLNRALTISQACWNLAIMTESSRQEALHELQLCVKMSDAEFDDFKRSVVLPMIGRHEEMFPRLHQPSSLSSPHWPDAVFPAAKSSSKRKKPSSLAFQPQPPLDLDEALRVLDEAFDEFPEAALRACQANRDAAIPRLIDVLERTVRFGQDGATPLGNATIFALFLLAEFKAAEATAAIWRFLKLPHDIPDQLLGDSITEDLPRILAIFAGPRLDLLDELILDQALNRWVRAAAVRASVYSVRDELLSRQDAICWLKEHLAEAVRRRDESLTDPLICTLVDLNANEARAEIELAFQEGLVDEWMTTLTEVNDELRPDAPAECNHRPHHSRTQITDTVEEMRGWNWQADTFDEFESDDSNDDDWTLGHKTPSPFPLAAEDFGGRHSITIRHEASRVGRNEPCPCGSGKKYKKCCLKSSAK